MNFRALIFGVLFIISGFAHAESSFIRHERQRLRNYIKAKLSPHYNSTPPLHQLANDKNLRRAANENSRAISELSGDIPSGASSYLRFLLQKYKVYDAVFHAAALKYQIGKYPKLTPLFSGLEHTRYTHLEIGLAKLGKNQLVATIVLLRRTIQINQLRQERGYLRICAHLLRGKSPFVLLTTPQGKVIQRRPKTKQKRFCTWLRTYRKGRYQFELTTEGKYGNEVALLFPLYLGTKAPSHPTERLYPSDKTNSAHAELRLLWLINQTRRQYRLVPLSQSSLLSKIARSHSVDMLSSGFFGHRSPRFGDLRTRLSYYALSHLYASENLAISTSAQRAHDSLLASPSHRDVLLDPKIIAVGVGVAKNPFNGLLYITECFAADPKKHRAQTPNENPSKKPESKQFQQIASK